MQPTISLRTALALGFALLAFIAVMGTSVLVSRQVARRYEGMISAEFSDIAGDVASHLNEGLAARLHDLQLLATMESLRDPAAPASERRYALRRMAETYAHPALLLLLSPDGKVQVTSDGVLEGVDLSSHPYAQAGRYGPFIGEVRHPGEYSQPDSRANSPRLVDLAAPVFDGAGHLVGVVASQLFRAWAEGVETTISDKLRQRRPGAEILVVGHGGQVLIGPPPLRGKPFPPVSLSNPWATWPDGSRYLIGTAAAHGPPTVTDLGWHVLVRQNASQALAPIAELQWVIAVTGLGLALLTGLLAWPIAGWLARPMHGLAIAATALGRDEAFGLPVSRLIEVEAIGTALRQAGRERAAAEAALRQGRSQLRAIFDGTFEYIGLLTPDGMVLDANRAALELLGYSHSDIIGRKLWDCIPRIEDPTSPMNLRDCIVEAARGGFVRHETDMMAADGRRVTIDFSIRPVCDANGRVVLLVPEGRDITGLRAAEAGLAESETRLRLALEGVGLGVFEWDPAADLVRLDARAAQFMQPEPLPTTWMRAGAAVFANWEWRIHPEDLWRRRYFLAALRAGRVTGAGLEYRVRASNGEWRWLMQRSAVLARDQASGRALRVVGVVQDITDQKLAESALRDLTVTLETRVQQEMVAREAAQGRAAQAERLQALGQLAGGIAHDFNNVLQVISGSATLIARRAADAASTRRLARIILEATDRGAAVTGRLLTFSRRGSLRAEWIDASTLLVGLCEVFSHTLGAGIRCHVTVEEDLPALLADKSQLETALVNLATNARDAMQGGGRLVLAAAVEYVGETHPVVPKPGRYVRLAVIDTGTGMDEATLARAMEPFFTTKPVGKGTGLGLAMAKGFAEQSGGALAVTTAPGRGTTVTLWLPEAPADAAVCIPQQLVGHQPVGNPVILLVDDDAMVREVMASELRATGYRVIEAESGAQALDVLEAGPVSLLVTDLSMAGMDGVALVRAAQTACPALPAIILTGYAGDSAALMLDGEVPGPLAVLRKPISMARLTDSIAAQLAAPAPS